MKKIKTPSCCSDHDQHPKHQNHDHSKEKINHDHCDNNNDSIATSNNKKESHDEHSSNDEDGLSCHADVMLKHERKKSIKKESHSEHMGNNCHSDMMPSMKKNNHKMHSNEHNMHNKKHEHHQKSDNDEHSCHDSPMGSSKKWSSTEEHNHNEVQQGFLNSTIKITIGILFLIPAFWIMFSNLFDTHIPSWIINPIFQLIMATFIIGMLGTKIFVLSLKELKHKRIGVSTTLTLSLLTAYIFSLSLFIYRMIQKDWSGEDYFFDAIVEINVIIFIGRMIDNHIVKKTTKDISEIDKLFVDKVLVKRNKDFVEEKIENIKVHDVVLVKPGDVIPLDGVVISGVSEVDESSFTGESLPASKKNGAAVFAGTTSLTGTIHIQIEQTVENTEFSKIVQNIEETQKAKSKTQDLADKIGKIFLPFLILSALIGFIVWGSVTSDWTKAISVFVTTLIIACPVSLVLITPFVAIFANQKAIKNNIKLQSKTLFEGYRKLDAVVFDKTGTITKGKMEIVQNTIPEKYFDILYTIEKNSNHAISHSIVKYVNDNHEVKEVEGEYKVLPGKGASLKIKNKFYYIGSLKFAKETINDFEFDDYDPGEVLSFLFDKKEVFGHVRMRDEIKEASQEAINLFKEMKIKTIMITGDNEKNANFVAEKLGIDEYHSEVSPTGKMEIIDELISGGDHILFAGDGINDALAIEKADIGIAMNSGTALSKTSSDAISLNNDLISIINILKIIKKANQSIKGGLYFSVVWITILIAISLSGTINPAVGALGMVVNDILPLGYGLNVNFTKMAKTQEITKTHH